MIYVTWGERSLFFFFFFSSRRRHTRSDRDWSSDVCSSDLTAARILAEIDRLDAIARAFSRFASPQAEQLPLEPVDLYAVAREVVRLYTLGGSGERRVGEEGRSRWAPYHLKKKKKHGRECVE